MPKKPGRGGGSRRKGRSQSGAPARGAAGKRGRGPGGRGQRPQKSDYFMQPGKRGVFIVLRRPIGNRIDAKVCGTMPSRVHAKMLIDSLERAESVVKDLFMEATDDGIEALEAVLTATCEDVLRRGPRVEVRAETDSAAGDDSSDEDDPYAQEAEESEDAEDSEEDGSSQ